MRALAAAIARAAAVVPLVVVHGGGREIDAALTRAGIGKRQVDGVRVTDEATLASSWRCSPERSTRGLSPPSMPRADRRSV